MPHYFVLILGIACLTYSCAAYKETYNNPDRRCWTESILGIGAIKCEAFIKFQCTEDLTLLTYSPITRPKKLNVKRIEGIEAPKVGDLLAHNPTPIFLKSGSPWVTLHDDISQILSQLGYVVGSNHDDVKNVVEADIKLLDVQTIEGGWNDLKGTTLATVAFSIVLQKSTGEVLWTEEFTGKHQIKIVYAYLSDSEETLGWAYCHALKSFADSVQAPEFYNRVK